MSLNYLINYLFIYLIMRLLFFILGYVTSSDDIQPSTLIMDQSPSGLLLDIK